MIDPVARWAEFGEKPGYAGLLSFSALPYTEDPGGLAGADAAIVGAPMDELVCEYPGTRLGPRAIRMASFQHDAHLEAGVNPRELRVVDFGDAPVVPGAPVRTHDAIERTVAAVVAAGAVPLVLGGDHSIAEPDVRACAAAHGPVGLVHFDSHTDTAPSALGAERNHGTPMYRLVESGHVDPRRYVQIGLRGYWPGEEIWAWQRKHGITSLFMHDIRDRGIVDVIRTAVDVVGGGPMFLSVDIDVLDPAFAPGTGTPEPGGMTTADLLWACRALASHLDVVGMDVVEVIPTAVGTYDITALAAARIVHETLTGMALARAGRPVDFDRGTPAFPA